MARGRDGEELEDDLDEAVLEDLLSGNRQRPFQMERVCPLCGGSRQVWEGNPKQPEKMRAHDCPECRVLEV